MTFKQTLHQRPCIKNSKSYDGCVLKQHFYTLTKCCLQWRDFCWRLGGRAPKVRVSSAVGARIDAPKAPRAGRVWGGCSPPHWEGTGRGFSTKFFDFEAQKGEFWCILGATFAVELNQNWLGHWVACTDWWVLVTFLSHLTLKSLSLKMMIYDRPYTTGLSWTTFM